MCCFARAKLAIFERWLFNIPTPRSDRRDLQHRSPLLADDRRIAIDPKATWPPRIDTQQVVNQQGDLGVAIGNILVFARRGVVKSTDVEDLAVKLEANCDIVRLPVLINGGEASQGLRADVRDLSFCKQNSLT